MPIRVQRKRAKGWRMPANTIYVGPGSKWGNPFPTHEPLRDGHGDIIRGKKVEIRSPQKAVSLYADMMMPYRHHGPKSTTEAFLLSQVNLDEIQDELRGKNLCCWCPLDQPCHADFLLEMANVPL